MNGRPRTCVSLVVDGDAAACRHIPLDVHNLRAWNPVQLDLDVKISHILPYTASYYLFFWFQIYDHPAGAIIKLGCVVAIAGAKVDKPLVI